MRVGSEIVGDGSQLGEDRIGDLRGWQPCFVAARYEGNKLRARAIEGSCSVGAALRVERDKSLGQGRRKLVAAELDAARNKLLHQRRGDVPGAMSGRRRGTPTAS
jgi:hypothetical protein